MIWLKLPKTHLLNAWRLICWSSQWCWCCCWYWSRLCYLKESLHIWRRGWVGLGWGGLRVLDRSMIMPALRIVRWPSVLHLRKTAATSEEVIPTKYSLHCKNRVLQERPLQYAYIRSIRGWDASNQSWVISIDELLTRLVMSQDWINLIPVLIIGAWVILHKNTYIA